MSLRARLLTGMALIAVVLALAAGFIARTTERHLIDQVDAQLARAQAPPPDRAAPRGQDERLSSVFVSVFDPRSRQFVVYAEPNLSADAPPVPELTPERALELLEQGKPVTIDGYRLLVRNDRLRVAALTFVYALPLADVEEAVDRLIAVESVAVLAILGVLALVTWWVIRLGVQPIKQMTETATAIAGGDLSRRVPDVAPGTEAGELGDALNLMLGRIEASQERLKQFVADASHELRTPITTIRGYAELYRNGGLTEAGELDEALRRTEQEAMRMGGLVDDLLHLARLDQGRPLEQRPVDLAALTRDAVRDAQAVAPDRSIGVDTDPTLVVQGDDARLRQVLANLVTNAVVHTDAGTPVEVRAHRVGDDAVVEVADRGAGMSPEVAARAFERFYRADVSRSRHRGGSGLGLAIVEATVTAHGGAVHLDSRPGAGTTVRVVLPLTS
ncbi:MAG TPA: HAMP domain-containing sensor histidine kinase [Acidimicrobiales bacterium]|nr:HAMP domain-containing sensor histidine kinase [Acidimicrobiales bacterium]